MFEKPNRAATTTGCLIAVGSAMVTALMLLVNGSLVMAILSELASNGPPWVAKREFSQFVLFTVPVLLVIGQWMMIDYVRNRLSRHSMDRPSN